MGFRTLDIGKECEIHIKDGQLEISMDEGRVYIPIEDLNQITAHGANIRLSTMDLSILTSSGVAFTTMDDKYLPTAIVLPFDGNSRQSAVMHKQVSTDSFIYKRLWIEIIRKKIINQATVLRLLHKEGAETIEDYAININDENVDYNEAIAAKKYFESYQLGLNRREESPINSKLNYGYAVVRSCIARSLVTSGFHPSFGIHHSNQTNAFNLADDLIEPFRPCVDLLAKKTESESVRLSKEERREMSSILYNACICDNTKISITTAVDMMVESLKRIIMDDSNEELVLPRVLPIEILEGVSE